MLRRVVERLFSKKTSQNIQADKKMFISELERMEAYSEGLSLFKEGKYEEALGKLDVAVDAGYTNEVYAIRGNCLQCLGYHFDAIDDFTKAIEVEPNNLSSNYHGRAISKKSVGDFENGIKDLELALQFAKLAEGNRKAQMNNWAKQQGRSSILDYYEEEIRKATFISESDESFKAMFIDKPYRRNKKVQ